MNRTIATLSGTALVLACSLAGGVSAGRRSLSENYRHVISGKAALETRFEGDLAHGFTEEFWSLTEEGAPGAMLASSRSKFQADGTARDWSGDIRMGEITIRVQMTFSRKEIRLTMPLPAVPGGEATTITRSRKVEGPLFLAENLACHHLEVLTRSGITEGRMVVPTAVLTAVAAPLMQAGSAGDIPEPIPFTLKPGSVEPMVWKDATIHLRKDVLSTSGLELFLWSDASGRLCRMEVPTQHVVSDWSGVPAPFPAPVPEGIPGAEAAGASAPADPHP